ncbi:MAG TPA: A/G-specific adenine glycosylase [Candidatus Eisenbacteria bacterium]|nr:A/G-specific adenine glycosylase [Candidatus Eisenbacteria bacterium]
MSETHTALRRAILRWYLRNRRDLPWRRTRDPYAIWVSEIMLQQTRVETVIPFYERFLERFPTVHSLADAHEDAVIAAWSGLGYYRRARHLRAAAAVVVREHGGRVPEDLEALRRLPGIGEYTAAAIASVAFGRAAAAVDGNVIRVLARIEGLRGSRVSSQLKRDVTRTAERLAGGRNPGDWTQALMELGALICLPRDPRCGDCPVRAMCAARASGEPGRYPEALATRAPQRVERVMLAAWKGDRLFLVRETAGEPTAWTIPLADSGANPRRTAKTLAKRLGLSGTLQGPVVRFRHRTFAEDSGFEVWSLDGTPNRGRPGEAGEGGVRLSRSSGRWVSPAEVDKLPTRGPTLKAIKKLRP